jgi:hypothetical protein
MMVVMGIFFIVLGLLVYKFPMLISGYNTMPKKEREKINIKPVVQKIRLVFGVMGAILIVVPYLFKLMGVSEWSVFMLIIVTFGGVIIILAWVNLDPEMSKINKTAYSSKSAKIGIGILIVVVALVFGGIYKTAQPAEIKVTDGKLIISGTYGVDIPLSEITKVEVIDHLPRVIIRTNGLGLGRYSKGYFRLEKYGRSLLFLHSGKPPYLVLATEKNGAVVINRSTPEEIYYLQRLISE